MTPKQGQCIDCVAEAIEAGNSPETVKLVGLVAKRCQRHYWPHRNAVNAEKKGKGTPPPPKQRTPIKKKSDTQAKRDKIYFSLLPLWKRLNPLCLAKIPGICTTYTQDCHHVKGRDKWYLDTLTWLPICRACHDWIKPNDAEARRRGLIFYPNEVIDLGTIPLTRYGDAGLTLQDGNGTDTEGGGAS